MRILLVEDDEAIRDLVTGVLEGAGYEVSAAADGQEALDMLPTVAPHAMVVDINMPGMDGLALLNAVRRDPTFAEIPALMLTAQTSPEDIRRSMNLGAADFIGKPFEARVLLRRLERMVRSAS